MGKPDDHEMVVDIGEDFFATDRGEGGQPPGGGCHLRRWKPVVTLRAPNRQNLDWSCGVRADDIPACVPSCAGPPEPNDTRQKSEIAEQVA